MVFNLSYFFFVDLINSIDHAHLLIRGERQLQNQYTINLVSRGESVNYVEQKDDLLSF